MEAFDMYHEGQIIAVLLVKEGNKNIFDYLVAISTVDVLTQCIFGLN